jgi:hypothetical protein
MYNRNDNTSNTKLSQWFPAHNVQLKVRRTHGWLCPYKDYKSNKRFNTQRHINKIHGGGEPVDSRTGETLAQKMAGALHTLEFSNIQSGYVMPDPNVVIAGQLKELSDNRTANIQAQIPMTPFENNQGTRNVPMPTTYKGSYSMPFLDAQEKRVKELGYDVPRLSQNLSFLTQPDKTMTPSLGGVKFPGSIDLNVRDPYNMNLNNVILNPWIQKYQSNSDVDYVDQLATYDPAMALWKEGRDIAILFKNELNPRHLPFQKPWRK